MLTSLSHGAVGSSDNEDSAVHLSSTGDHVLDVVSMARAVNVCIVTLVGFVLDVSNRNGDTALALFRSLIDVLESREVRMGSTMRPVVHGQGLGNGCRQRGLTMVDVADRTNVNMRLGTLELLLCHSFPPYFGFRLSKNVINNDAPIKDALISMVAVTGFEPVTPRV